MSRERESHGNIAQVMFIVILLTLNAVEFESYTSRVLGVLLIYCLPAADTNSCVLSVPLGSSLQTFSPAPGLLLLNFDHSDISDNLVWKSLTRNINTVC